MAADVARLAAAAGSGSCAALLVDADMMAGSCGRCCCWGVSPSGCLCRTCRSLMSFPLNTMNSYTVAAGRHEVLPRRPRGPHEP